MAKRKANGEGCIYQRANGLWAAQLTIGRDPDTGKLKRVSFSGKSHKEVQAKITKALHEVQTGNFVAPTKITTGEWLKKWLEERMKNHLRPTTWDSYEYLIRVHIKPAIGHIQLKHLVPTHLQDLYNKKIEAGRQDGAGGLSPRSVRYIHTVIHAALQQALKEGLVGRNVADAVVLPKQGKKEMRVLSREEAGKFLDAVEEDRLYAAFLLDLASGLRRGELLGLRWQDLDLKEGLIRVNQSLVCIGNQEGEKRTRLIFQEPKTKTGKRIIPLPEDILPILKAHKARQAQEKLLLGQAYQDNGLVFCTEEGKPIHPRNFTRKFHSLIKQAGVDHANLHALRHTYATRLLEENEHPKIVQELLGHSQISMTLDTYSHVSPDLKRKAAAKLNDILKPKKNASTGEEKK